MRLRSEENIIVFISLYDDEFYCMKCLNMLEYDWIWFGWLEIEEDGFKSDFFGEENREIQLCHG